MKTTYTKFDESYFYKAVDPYIKHASTIWRCDGIVSGKDGEFFRFIAVSEKEATMFMNVTKKDAEKWFEYIPEFYNINKDTEGRKESEE